VILGDMRQFLDFFFVFWRALVRAASSLDFIEIAQNVNFTLISLKITQQ
jgi:hypothetical protein